jgi:hypothetical protein
MILAAADSMAWGSVYSGFMLGLFGLALLLYGKKAERPALWLAGLVICCLPALPVAIWQEWLAAGGVWAGGIIASRLG